MKTLQKQDYLRHLIEDRFLLALMTGFKEDEVVENDGKILVMAREQGNLTGADFVLFKEVDILGKPHVAQVVLGVDNGLVYYRSCAVIGENNIEDDNFYDVDYLERRLENDIQEFLDFNIRNSEYGSDKVIDDLKKSLLYLSNYSVNEEELTIY